MAEDVQSQKVIFKWSAVTVDGTRDLYTCALCPETLHRPLKVKQGSRNKSLLMHRLKKHREHGYQILTGDQNHQV